MAACGRLIHPLIVAGPVHGGPAQGLGGATHVAVFEFVSIGALVVERIAHAEIGAHRAQHAIGVRFNGKDRNDVEEYCLSEGWIKVPAGKTLDRKGNPLLIKLKGKVEVYYPAAA